MVPIYDYACTTCDTRFDELVRFDAPSPPCPSCGGEETERLLSMFRTPNVGSGQTALFRDLGSGAGSQPFGGHPGSGGGCGHSH